MLLEFCRKIDRICYSSNILPVSKFIPSHIAESGIVEVGTDEVGLTTSMNALTDSAPVLTISTLPLENSLVHDSLIFTMNCDRLSANTQ
jgi:hypothetical protein